VSDCILNEIIILYSDSIEANVESASASVEHGTQQLHQARISQVCFQFILMF